jgi:hypothetical protein
LETSTKTGTQSKRLTALVLALLLALTPILALPATAVATATATTPWDGTSYDYTWYNGDDTVFHLTTAAQFAGFAAIVNNKQEVSALGAVTGINTGIPADDFSGKTVYLDVDVDLGAVNTEAGWSGNAWPIIGYYTSSAIGTGSSNGTVGRPFKGTFDGQFHKISNLYVPYDGASDDNALGNSHGLFGDLGATGIVKNFVVTSGFVKGARFTAGIVGRNWGTVDSVINHADVVGNGRAGAGGIVGANYDNGPDPYVKNAINYGSVYNSKNATAGTPSAGGIVSTNEGYIQNSLNLGTVTTGGITNFGGIATGIVTAALVTNSYYLDTAAARPGGVTAKTADEIKAWSFAAVLGDAFVADYGGNNGGYPTLLGYATAQGWPTEAPQLHGGETITAGGDYTLAADATGIITISTTAAVTITGNGIGTGVEADANVSLYIKYTVAGANLTINNVYLRGKTDNSILDFIGLGNTLTIAGTNLIEKNGLSGGAATGLIHVPDTASLLVNGDGTLYFYKQGAGAAFGGVRGEANGALTFDGPTIFGKGTHQGALIGTGANASLLTAGDIRFISGEYTITNIATGAAIGGGGGNGGAGGGNVYIEGGLFNINTDYSGAAIGGGGYSGGDNTSLGGNVFISGGSIRTFIDFNAVFNNDGDYPNNPSATWDVTNYGISDNSISARKLNNETDRENVYQLAFDTSEVTPVDGKYTVKFDDSDTPYYVGGTHNYKYINEHLTKSQQLPVDNTLSNWTANTDTNLYLYATGENHKIVVNDETFYAIWNGDTHSFEITDVEPEAPVTIVSIDLVALPTKLAYAVGGTFDAAGISIVATYSDETTAAVTAFTISNEDELTTDDTQITVSGTFGGESFSFDIEITVVIAGDISGDGEIGQDDTIDLQALILRGNLTPEEFARADLNGDGKVNLVDVALLKKLLKDLGA